jgi:hypothetical protein
MDEMMGRLSGIRGDATADETEERESRTLCLMITPRRGNSHRHTHTKRRNFKKKKKKKRIKEIRMGAQKE